MTALSASQPPHGLACEFTPDAPPASRAAARRFCLETIRDVYGTAYRPDWHADLDSLTGPTSDCWFSRASRGAFWTLSSASGEIVATAGLYALIRKPTLVAALADRYPSPDNVTQLVRVYVRKDLRGSGIGRWLTAFAEAETRALGFAVLYLHAASDAKATTAFWSDQGFVDFASADGTTHFDKLL